MWSKLNRIDTCVHLKMWSMEPFYMLTSIYVFNICVRDKIMNHWFDENFNKYVLLNLSRNWVNNGFILSLSISTNQHELLAQSKIVGNASYGYEHVTLLHSFTGKWFPRFLMHQSFLQAMIVECRLPYQVYINYATFFSFSVVV